MTPPLETETETKTKSEMILKGSTIFINNLRLYTHHGVLEQEQSVGAWFIVSLCVHYNISKVMESDDIKDALSYADVVEVVKEEMAKPSRLLEHVAGRIARSIIDHFPQAQRVYLKLTKENPPMGIDCSGCGVEIICTRKDENA